MSEFRHTFYTTKALKPIPVEERNKLFSSIRHGTNTAGGNWGGKESGFRKTNAEMRGEKP